LRVEDLGIEADVEDDELNKSLAGCASGRRQSIISTVRNKSGSAR
jgi:hypothetical protein